MQEMACSLDRPPKTTATRGLRCGSFDESLTDMTIAPTPGATAAPLC
jgi:hypothetical protein